jgi:hypothetical protein
MPAARHFLPLVSTAFLVFMWLMIPVWAQTRAGDATPVGSFTPLPPIDFFLPSAVDATVLPGCIATVGVYDCNTQIGGRIYLPQEIENDDGVIYPIIILMHGNHLSCGRPYDATKDRADLNTTPPPHIDDNNQFTGRGTCPSGYSPVLSEAGYDYLGTRLASRGYVVMSVDAARGIAGLNMVNGVADPFLILARGRLVLRNLQNLSEWNSMRGESDPYLGVDLFHKLDFSQLGMFGHSRGGEGVRAAYNLYFSDPAGTNWKTRIGDVGFQAIFELAPTDFRNLPVINMPLDADDVVWTSLLPACDGDIATLDGMHPFDRMLKSAGSFDRISTYLVWGANHNFYNNQWQTTDSLDTSKQNQDIPGPTCFLPANLVCVDPNVNFPDNTPMFGNSIFAKNANVQQSTALSSVVAFFRSTVDVGTNAKFDANFNPLVGVPGQVTFPNGKVFLYPPRCIEREYSRPPVSENMFEDFTDATGFNSHSGFFFPIPNITGGSKIVTYQHQFGVQLLNDRKQRVARIDWTTINKVPKDPPYFLDNWTLAGIGMDVSAYVTLDFRVARTANQAANSTKTTDFSIWLVGTGGVPPAGPVKLSDALAQGVASLTGPTGEQFNDSVAVLHPYMETVRIRLKSFPNFARVQKSLHGVKFVFDQTPTGSIYLANITLSPDLGPGIPAAGAMSSAASSFSAQELAAPSTAEKRIPLVHSGAIDAMRLGVTVYDLSGRAHSGGVRIEISSDHQLPAGDAAMVLRIGSSRFITGNLVDPYHAVFTLTREEFDQLNEGDLITLQTDFSENPSRYWDFGPLIKGLASQ